MSFFDAVWMELKRSSFGVHSIALPASPNQMARAAAEQLDGVYMDCLRHFCGLSLFHDQLVLFSVGEEGWGIRKGPFFQIGMYDSDSLWLDPSGFVYRMDETDGDVLRVGSTVERLLAAFLVRGYVLFDIHGEFLDVFDEEGQITSSAKWKRIQRGKKKDPKATLYLLEEAEAWMEEANMDKAVAVLQEAVAQDVRAAPCWEMLGGLLHQMHRTEDAANAYVQSALESFGPRLKAHRWLQAAHLQVGHERKESISQAWSVFPSFLEECAQKMESFSSHDEEDAKKAHLQWQLLLEAVPSEHEPVVTKCKARLESVLIRLRTRERLGVFSS